MVETIHQLRGNEGAALFGRRNRHLAPNTSNRKYCREKLAQTTRKYTNLKSELYETQDFNSKETFSKRRPHLLRKKNLPSMKMQELKLAFSEFYLFDIASELSEFEFHRFQEDSEET